MKKNNKNKKCDTEDENDSDIYEEDSETPLGFRIKREKATTLVHKSKLLKPNSNFIIITGATGTGKSTMLLSLLPMFSNQTKYIILASKKLDDPVHKSVEKYCKKEKIQFDIVHDVNECSTKLSELLDTKNKNEHAIIIFDDFNTEYSSRGEEPHNNIMIKCFAMMRSSNCSGIAITQSYSNIPTKVRENTTMRIVFSMGNVYSVRALIDDTAGLFYSGDNEKQVRKDIQNIYKQVHIKPHQFIIITSGYPSPQIRLGWNKVLYPIEQEGEIVGGSIKGKKRGKSDGLSLKQKLYKQAKELGYPPYMFNTASKKALEEYIKVATARAQKQAGNTAPELDEILENEDYGSEPVLRRKLNYNVRRYRTTSNPKLLDKIAEFVNLGIKKNFWTVMQMRYYLKKNLLSDIIDI